MGGLDSLCATLVQSSAALVAIVAGFMLTYLLALSTERSGLHSRLQDVEALLLVKRRNCQDYWYNLGCQEAMDLVNDVIDDILESDGEYPLRKAVQGRPGLEEKDVQYWWDKAMAATRNAFRLLREHPEWLADFEGFQGSLRARRLEWFELRMYWIVWEHLTTGNSARTAWSSVPAGVLSGIRMTKPDYLMHLHMDENRQMLADADLAWREVMRLEAQADDLRARLAAFAIPAGLGGGIAVLAYISVVGIMAPLFVTLVSGQNASHLDHLGWTLVALFCSGLVLFFCYLWRSIRRLTAMSEENSLGRCTQIASWADRVHTWLEKPIGSNAAR